MKDVLNIAYALVRADSRNFKQYGLKLCRRKWVAYRRCPHCSVTIEQQAVSCRSCNRILVYQYSDSQEPDTTDKKKLPDGCVNSLLPLIFVLVLIILSVAFVRIFLKIFAGVALFNLFTILFVLF